MTVAEEPPRRRRPGRPARLDQATIAEAALEIGLERASMREVAERLGVSVAGLYHHVANRQELLRLAAERSMGRLALPEDRGQHWSAWLREWARYSRGAFVADPALFIQYVSGALDPERLVEVIDGALEVLTRQGFEPAEALAAFDAAGWVAVGAAVETIRQRAALEAGRPLAAEVHRILAARPGGELAGVRAAFAHPADHEARFEDNLTALLVGIAMRRGEDWRDVVAEDRGAVTA